MRVAVFGAGGVGGFFGARLARGGADVHLIARGEHLKALRSRGLLVLSASGNVDVALPATDRPEEVGAVDVVLFCVKSNDTERAARRIPPLLHRSTAVITFQNGVDNEEKIASIVGPGHACGGIAYIMATISAPGEITHVGKLARLIFGELDAPRSERLVSFHELCTASGIDAELSEDIRQELWRKFAMICAVAGMTAAVRLPIGEIRDSPEAFSMFERISREVTDLARKEGVPLPGDTPQRIVELTRSLPADMYSSLHYDLTHGKPMELEALHGTVVRLARRHRLPVPASEAVLAILEPWARREG
ncbi:MAG TPA: 2-dehydropantoate 2-reductase [Vicinamibacteria bacterium]|nr:2-dehydropantoate 2-reductase [Vicinamibacteria bacterium]